MSLILQFIFSMSYSLCSPCFCCCSISKSCPTLCKSMNCSLPGFSVHGIFQAKILKWVAISYSRGSSPPRDGTCISCISCIGRWIVYHWKKICHAIIRAVTWLYYIIQHKFETRNVTTDKEDHS